MSEGRGTGIPTIQDELRRNGSSPAVIETNEERSYFLIEIPCREGFEDEPLNGMINYDINERESDVLTAIAKSPNIKKGELAERLNVAIRTLSRSIQILSSEPYSLIEYHGAKKTGGYVLTERGEAYIKSLK